MAYALLDCRVTNAVRCVPPENKPVGAEVQRRAGLFYSGEIGSHGQPASKRSLALGTA